MSINVYELVTNRIIEQLENNIIPWEKPWSGTIDGAFNRISKKPYSILNQMLLKYDGEYASFKQWKDLGGHIRKGEKSEIVVFWKMYPIKEKQDDGTEIIKTIPLLKYINVFHISQVDGVEPLKQKVTHDIEPIDKAEKILNDYWNRENITIEHVKGDKAFYSPMFDKIQLPLCQYFSLLLHSPLHTFYKYISYILLFSDIHYHQWFSCFYHKYTFYQHSLDHKDTP